MKRRRLWTGVAAAAVVTGVVTGWAELSGPDTPTASADSSAAAAASAGKADALLGAGIKQGELNDFAGASRTFRQVLDLDPGSKLAWYNLGVIAQHDGRTTDARTAYDQALTIDPAFESALYNEALLFESSDTDQAVTLLRRIVAADPKAATAYLHLGQALAKKGRDNDAGGAFALAVRADPSLRQLVPEQFRSLAKTTTSAAANAAPTPTPTPTQAGTSR